MGETKQHGVERLSIRVGMLVLSVLPLALGITRRMQGDLPHYVAAVFAWRDGGALYREVTFEYPPYAFLLFSPAAWAHTVRGGCFILGGLFALGDLGLKALLLREGLRARRTVVPFVLYTLLTWAWQFWYLKRFDVLVAGMLVGALTLLARQKPTGAGVLISLGVLTKLFPALVLPFALRWARSRRMLVGLLLGAGPALVLAVRWPWWSFLRYHAGRGLQVESAAASVLWALKRPLKLDVTWVRAQSSYELHGALAEEARRVSSVVWVLLTVASILFTMRGSAPTSPAGWAKRLLPALLAFVAFNPVLSPQYLVWIASVACLALCEGTLRGVGWVMLAGVLTAVIYPAESYHSGLDGLHTAALVLRNAVLMVAWGAALNTNGPERSLTSPRSRREIARVAEPPSR